MAITINLRYTGKNNAAQAFARDKGFIRNKGYNLLYEL